MKKSDFEKLFSNNKESSLDESRRNIQQCNTAIALLLKNAKLATISLNKNRFDSINTQINDVIKIKENIASGILLRSVFE